MTQIDPAVLQSLQTYLEQRGLIDGPMTVRPLGEGQSNETYLVSSDAGPLVLRKPPPGPHPPGAHDVLREARIMAALLDTDVPVPRVLAAEEEGVLPVSFYLMDYIEGDVVIDTLPERLDGVDARRRLSESLVDTLAAVHRVDLQRTELNAAAGAGYLARQLKRFGAQWQAAGRHDVPEVGRVGDWLTRRLPADPGVALVHGDFRLGNVIVSPDGPPRVAAVLDWEMATAGAPLADLGYLTTFNPDPGDPSLDEFELGGLTRSPGFLTRDEMVHRYEQRSGRRVRDLRFYRVLALFKAAVFTEVNYQRAVTTGSDDLLALAGARLVPLLARRAAELAREEA